MATANILVTFAALEDATKGLNQTHAGGPERACDERPAKSSGAWGPK